MSGNIKGIFYGVSTGPGDPELMTVKAVRILKKADSIVAARVMGKQETALEIAKQAAGLDGKEILSLPFSMSGKMEAEGKEHENRAVFRDAGGRRRISGKGCPKACTDAGQRRIRIKCPRGTVIHSGRTVSAAV